MNIKFLIKNVLEYDIKNLSNLNKSYIHIFLLSIITILSIAYGNQYLLKFPDFVNTKNQIIIKNFQFDYGELIHNLYYNYEYKQNKHDIVFYLLRLPLLPIFNLALLKISLNFYSFIIIKNLIIFFLLNLSILYFLNIFNFKIKHYLILLIIFFYNPYNLHVILIIHFADTLNVILISIFYLMMIANNKTSILVGAVIMFLLYLSKSFLFLFCICYPFFDLIFNFLFNKKNNNFIYFKFITLFASVTLAILSWGIFGKVNANYFPFGSNISSYNSFALSSMLNKNFKSNYLEKGVDQLLDYKVLKEKKFKNEKEFYDFFNKRNKKYIKENLKEYINDFKIKINFIFFSIRKDAPNKDIAISNLANKPILLISLLLSVYFFIKNKDQISIQYLLIIVFYLTPLILGWATNKHLVPIFLISKIYLFLIYVKKNQNNFSI